MTILARQMSLRAFTLLVSALAFCLPAQCASAVLLKQKSEMMGFTNLLYSKEGIRLELLDSNRVILMRPPRWQIQYANTNTKVYWEGEPLDFKSNFTTSCSMFRPGDASTMQVTTVTSDQIDGLDCKKYKLVGQKYGNSKGRHSWQRLMVRDGNLWMLAAKGLPLANSRVLNKCFGAPLTPGVPVRMLVINNGNNENIEFDVRKCEHKKATAADFKVPSTYKKVDKQEKVNSFKASTEEFAEIFK